MNVWFWFRTSTLPGALCNFRAARASDVVEIRIGARCAAEWNSKSSRILRIQELCEIRTSGLTSCFSGTSYGHGGGTENKTYCWTLELEGMPESWSHSTSQVPPEIVSWFESPSVHSFSLKVLNTRHTKDVGEGHAYI